MRSLDATVPMVLAVFAGACSASPETPAHPPFREPPIGAPVAMAKTFVLSSNDPFWQATVNEKRVLLEGLDGQRMLVIDRHEVLFDGRHVMAHDERARIEIRVTARACRDSTSGAWFPYTGKMALDGGADVMGCARPASDPPPRPGG